jgi:hypothetical protein
VCNDSGQAYEAQLDLEEFQALLASFEPAMDPTEDVEECGCILLDGWHSNCAHMLGQTSAQSLQWESTYLSLLSPTLAAALAGALTRHLDRSKCAQQLDPFQEYSLSVLFSRLQQPRLVDAMVERLATNRFTLQVRVLAHCAHALAMRWEAERARVWADTFVVSAAADGWRSGNSRRSSSNSSRAEAAAMSPLPPPRSVLHAMEWATLRSEAMHRVVEQDCLVALESLKECLHSPAVSCSAEAPSKSGLLHPHTHPQAIAWKLACSGGPSLGFILEREIFLQSEAAIDLPALIRSWSTNALGRAGDDMTHRAFITLHHVCIACILPSRLSSSLLTLLPHCTDFQPVPGLCPPPPHTRRWEVLSLLLVLFIR